MGKIINRRMKFPKYYKSQEGKYGTTMENTETKIVVSEMETEKNKAPLDTIEIQNAEIKDLSYKPQSQSCNTVDTVVPASARYDMHKSIETIDRRVNGVDEYVAEKLGYIIGNCSIEQRQDGLKCLCDAYSAEQVDAIAVAIFNIEEKKQGCIIGDQTGIGKGRIAAGMIRYAIHRGLKPIFLTEKPNLFSDLYRDIISIGSDDAVPLDRFVGYKEVERKSVKAEDTETDDSDSSDEGFEEEETQIVRIAVYKPNKEYDTDIKGKKRVVPYIVNGRSSKTDIKDENGNILYKGLPANENKNIIDSAIIPADYNFILSTYSQFRGATDSTKMQFLLKIASGNIVIMDESHNASGASNVGTFLRKVLEQTVGVTFLSATFAKRPDNMPIYAGKTAMADANMTSDQLVSAITTGGVALQEIVSSALYAEGQMIRRERSFEGIEVNWEYLDASQTKRGLPNLDLEQKHRAIMDSATDIIRKIMDFQRDFVNPLIEKMDRIQKAEYKQVEKRKGTAGAGIDNQPIFSGVFNIVNQLLFSIKAEAVADVAIQRLKEGKKPVIAFANTMESFLNTITNADGSAVEEGDIINSDFSKIFEKRLSSVLRYTVKDAEGNSIPEMINVSEQDEDFRLEYSFILSKIKSASLGISSSPIDVLIDRIQKANFSVVEVTGRDRQLKMLGDGKAMIKSRVKIGANDAFRQFNQNEVDCLLINQSGSTGASAHALPNAKVPKEKVKQRVMIILQAELNINTEVQKRGRINRTGQIFKPIYDYVVSAIPAEKRLMMMLQKKLKSLDANTTSSQKESSQQLDVSQLDFLNKYGDQIVVDFLKENPLINLQIGDPLKMADLEEDEKPKSEDAAHRVSGRVAILSVKEQEQFYTELSQRYISMVEYLIQSGEYDLEVEDMNLQAETLEREVVIVGKGGNSVFGRNSVIEKCSVNNLKKPYTKVEIDAMLKESLQDYTAQTLKESLILKYNRFVQSNLENDIKQLEEHYANLIRDISKEKQASSSDNIVLYVKERTIVLNEAMADAIDRLKRVTSNKKEHIDKLLNFFHVGKVVGYPTVMYSVDGTSEKAIFLGFVINENVKNPYAPSAIKLRFAIAGSQRYLAVPASKFDIIDAVRSITYSSIFPAEQQYIIDNWDEIIKSKSNDRANRFIVTGNILQAFGNPQLKGSLISYTTSTGGLKKGILLPESFSMDAKGGRGGQEAMRITVPIIKAVPIIKSMLQGRSIITNSSFSIIRRFDDYRISAPLNKKVGGKFYLDPIIIKMTNEGTFNKIGDQMAAGLQLDRIENLIQYLQDNFNDSVNLSQQEFNLIKDSIEDKEYTDEVKTPEPDVFIEKIAEEDKSEEARRRAEEEAKKFEEEQALADGKLKEEQDFELEKRKLSAKKKLLNVIRVLQGKETMAKGGSVGNSEFDAVKKQAYEIGREACINNEPRAIAQNKKMHDFLFQQDFQMHDERMAIMKAFEKGYYDENKVELRKKFPEMYANR